MNSRVVIGIGILSLSLACSAQNSTPALMTAVPGEGPPSSQHPSAAQPQEDRIVAGRLIHKEDPKYPEEARKKKIQGQVVLQVTVDERGKVNRAAGISGDLSLVNAAEEAVLKWEFEPFTQNGHAVSIQQNLTFNFDLNRKITELELPLPEPKPLSASVASHLPIRLRVSKGPPPRVATGVFRVGGGVSAPQVSYSPDPEYSDEARRAQYQGTCVLSLIVGPDGLPRDIKVARSLGMGLDEKAIEAVKQWKFQPALKDGKPVAVEISIEVPFRL
jgi:TonB family protein